MESRLSSSLSHTFPGLAMFSSDAQSAGVLGVVVDQFDYHTGKPRTQFPVMNLSALLSIFR